MSELDEDVRVEAKRYSDTLNSVVGVFMFTTAIACLSFDHPRDMAFLFLTMVIPVYFSVVNKFFPPTIDTLRKLLKEHPDDEWIKGELDYLSGKYLGIRKIFTSNIVFWVGNVWYVLLLVWPGFATSIKALHY